MNTGGSLTVISGFSGSGKGTIVRELVKRRPEYAVSVSVTTRKPRMGERDGIEYHFITQEAFDRMVEEDGLLEYAGYVSHSYGTPKSFVEESIASGKDVILEIEVQGARQVKEKCPEAIFLFVMPPSAKELQNRLYQRGTETKEEIQGRLQRAIEEAGQMDWYDYLIVNDDLEEAIEQVHQTIQAAKNAPKRRMDLMNEMKRELKEISASKENGPENKPKSIG